MKNLYLIALLVITNFCFNSNSIAQQLLDAKTLSNGSIYYADLKDAKITNKDAIFTDLLKISSENSLKSEKTHVDNAGITHDYYQQYYKGIKVEGGNYTLHGKENIYNHISGNFEKIENLAVNVVINETAALQKVLSAVGAKEYAWENAEAEKFIKILRENPKASYLPKAELLIIRNWELFEKTGKINHHLCYAFYIRVTDPDLDLRVYIDAHTGEIVSQKSMLCHADGIADTRYSGRVSIKTEAVANGYRLHDTENNIQTLDAQQGISTFGIDFIDANNSWTEYDNATKDNAALDAHFGATKAVQYWKNTHNRQSFDDTNIPLKQLVHARVIERTFPSLIISTENASYSPTEKVVRYGDGGQTYKPLTALDWVAHETAHAYSFGLGFDGTLNTDTRDLHEGLSDIWAMCIDRDDWEFGDQVQNNGFSCTRSIENPRLNTAYNKGATTYGSSIYNSFTSNSYHNRGLVLAHWFYILCEGKNGINELGNNYAVQGITRDLAEQIVYEMYPYLSATGWAGVANAAKQAAKNRYGACSSQYVSVVNALYAVGLEPQMISLPTLQFSQTSAFICDNSTGSFTAQFSAANSATLYRWELPTNPTGITFLDGSYTSESTSATINVKVDFSVLGQNYISISYIPLTVSVACPTDPTMRISQTYLFWAGMPMSPRIQSHTPQACYDELYTIIANIGYGISDYIWQSATPNTLRFVSQSYNQAIFKVVGIGRATINMGASNICGTTPNLRPYSIQTRPCLEEPPCQSKDLCFLRYMLFPNPASSVVNINIDPTSNNINHEELFSLKVYNSLGILLYESTENENQVASSFSVATWSDGLYTVLIQTDRGTQALKLAIQKGSVAN